ncbi:unnamed protein product [Darwinula stevensoni]|uniref:Anti-proliferative protein domain-containing protein n=1 Tax=Darwinula stevensoni TaxID=69355 RepID=A0A7R9A3F8_9CRUS|nr:unnamed protein product [Darwinula stevensoni]CAG0881205.1 unnamed protein product [Darwinula stevensoni]
MRSEVTSAADFLVNILRLNANSAAITPHQLEMFRESLIEVLRRHYRDHWFPDKPVKGSGYRCIRINGKLDPIVAHAGALSGLLEPFLYSLFPSELTMWVDPKEVSYRIGENGSICVLYEEGKSPSPDHQFSIPSPPPTPPHLQFPRYALEHQSRHNSWNPCGKSTRRNLDFAVDVKNLSWDRIAPYVTS